MKKIHLLEFQQEVVDKGVDCLLNKRSFIFQSPTGTGKTFISANLINKFIENIPANEEYTFLHFSPSTGQLNEQNAIKFEEYKSTASLNRYETWKLDTTKQMTIGSFAKNKIHFFGWDSLIKKTNNVVGNMERGNWYDVLTTTLNKGTKVVIIIDEQHINKNSKSTDLFIDKIVSMHKEYFNEDPIRIEMSATVAEKDREKLDHRVYYSQAQREELVKKSILINKDLTGAALTDDEMLIHSAINKREEIIGAYNKRNLMKKGKLPLLVIQLPDGASSKGDITKTVEKTSEYVLSHEKMHKNHVAVWISGRHETLEGIKIEKEDVENNEDIAVLIFKQAVATGWDIPRANIWVKLRNNMDKAFETQTLGRVLRNQFRKYYNNELIDNAFIYTNDQKVKEEIEDTFGDNVGSAEKRIFNKKSEIPNSQVRKSKLAIIDYKVDEINFETVFDKLVEKVRNTELNWAIRELILCEPNLEDWTTSMWQSSKISDENQNIRDYIQTAKFDGNKLTLYKRWFEFKNKINNEIVQKVLEQLISEWAIENPTVRVTSRAYNFFYNDDGMAQEFSNIIKKAFRELSIKNEHIILNEFIPKEQVELFKDHIDWEKVSDQAYDNNLLYETSLITSKKKKNIFDSNVEREFYNELMNPLSGIMPSELEKFFIYNQVDAKQFYYVSYIDKNFKIRKYFPDFIIVTNGSIFILDTKTYDGENLKVSGGADSEMKMDIFNQLLEQNKINEYTDKKVKFGYVYKKSNNWYVVEKTRKEGESFKSKSISDFMKE